MAEYVPVFPGRAESRTAYSAVTGGQLVEVAGSWAVQTAAAGSTKVVGVAAFDAVSGDTVTVHCGGTQRLVAGTGGITAGDVVAAGADGTVVAIGGGAFAERIGVALSTAAEDGIAEIRLSV